MLAATVAAQKPGTILSMVAWAFSIAQLCLFPRVGAWDFWQGATRLGALMGMVFGILISVYYIFRLEFDTIPWLGISGLKMEPWFEIQSTSAGCSDFRWVLDHYSSEYDHETPRSCSLIHY